MWNGSRYILNFFPPALQPLQETTDYDQTRDRWLDFRRMQVASDQITFLVESSDDITQDSEVFVPVRIVLDSVSLTRSDIQE